MKPRKPSLWPGLFTNGVITYLKSPASKKLQTLKILPLLGCLLPQLLLYAQPSNKAMAGKKYPDSITLKNKYDSLRNEDVQLIYTKVPRNLTASATDVVYNRDLIKSPVTSAINAAVGRLAGVYSQQFSGQPGSDGMLLDLHGRTPLVMIDGVARSLTQIDLEEIESITILKDAVATAMMGVRGANGVLLIVTKKGYPGKPVISFTAQTGIQKALGLVKPLDAYNYALLKNEAIDNELKTNPTFNGVKYSAADLSAWQNGTDSFAHPNVNWQDQLFKSTAPINRYNFSARGGNDITRYYVSLEHLNQDGFLKNSDANNYSTNNWIKSYLARTNVDINLSKKLTAGVALFGRIINNNNPGALGGGVNDIYNGIVNTPNNAYPVFNANGSYYGNSNYLSNLQAQSTGVGYTQVYTRDILVDIFLRRSLDEILPGLWVKAKASYSSTLSELWTRTKNLVVFSPNGTGGYTQFGTVSLQSNNNNIINQGRSNYAELAVGYDHIFNQKHGINVLLLGNSDNIFLNNNFVNNTLNNTDGSYLPYIVSGYSGRVSYNYNKKYVLEGAFAYNGSNRYNEPNNNTRFGFFPSVGAAWNISEEDFAKNIKVLSTLKLYGSYGKTGWDNPGYYSYIQRYNNNSNVYFGTAATNTGTLVQSTLANPNLTWEKVNKFTLGLQGGFLANKLGFTVEYYNNKYSDLLQQRGRSTSIIGTTYPNENIGQNTYSGFDLQLNWQDAINKFSYFISANASIQTSKVIYADEVNQPYDYMKRTGNKVGRGFGYVADGLFQSQAEITGKPTFLGYTPQPGDIRYKDLNGDGFIDQLDQTAIGTNKPFIGFGVNLGFSIAGFDVSALFQGALNRDLYLAGYGNAFFAFQNGGLGQAFDNNLDRWTPTNTGASMPRVGIGNNNNNQAFSSFYMRKGDFARLKNMEIGYSLPRSLTDKMKMAGVRIFANGLNLITWSALTGNRDPEIFGNYPIQRVLNFGLNIKF